MPPGSTAASLVWMWVWVPITAVTRPSSSRPSATFSLVASAWKSTSTTSARERASATSPAATSKGLWAASRYSWPIRLITATRVPSAAAMTATPRPGALAAWLAGRTIRSFDSRNG